MVSQASGTPGLGSVPTDAESEGSGGGCIPRYWRKDRKARVGAAVFPLSEGVRPSESLSKGLSFLHSLTRSSREHLRSGKDRKTAGFMVTPGFAAGTGQGWVGLGKGWAPGAGGSGRSSRQQDLVLWTRSSSREHPGQLPERPRTPSFPGPAHLGAYWEM